jgi:formylglycine-generating enzyme required for sulfatase activity
MKRLCIVLSVFLSLFLSQNLHAKETFIEFVSVKGGCYQMGDDNFDSFDLFDLTDTDEGPAHEVCVDDFQIGKYEVTQGQWQAVMGSNPSRFKECGADCPVENVSWNDVQKFIEKLNSQGKGKYRLPTEAEWEYAAKGGTDERYSGSNNVDVVAWYSDNSGNKTHKVGQKQANKFDLYDMSGNVSEWVEDAYDSNAYGKHERNNPVIKSDVEERVRRGGAWNSSYDNVRSEFRREYAKSKKYGSLGFRLVLDAGIESAEVKSISTLVSKLITQWQSGSCEESLSLVSIPFLEDGHVHKTQNSYLSFCKQIRNYISSFEKVEILSVLTANDYKKSGKDIWFDLKDTKHRLNSDLNNMYGAEVRFIKAGKIWNTSFIAEKDSETNKVKIIGVKE